MFANFWSPERSRGAYASLAAFLEDVARILREEVEELAEYGASYIQLDAPHYPLLLDPKTRAFYEAQGWSTEEWLDLGVALDNKVMAGIDGVTFGLHLCRGNQGSRWLVSGDYGPIAKPIFQRTAAHRLLLEYDDARSGGFEPLQHVPDDKMVVLGLITTKRGELENADELVSPHRGGELLRRPRAFGIEPAMRFRDIDHRQQADAGAAGREAPACLRRRRKGLGLNALLFWPQEPVDM